jgi:hypothetical protein
MALHSPLETNSFKKKKIKNKNKKKELRNNNKKKSS